MAVLLGACASAGGPGGERVRFGDPAAESTALFLQGRMLELDGKLLEAAAAYEAAAALDPESAELFQRTAQVWARMGQPEKALEFATVAHALDPDDDGARRGLATLYVALKRYGDAAGLLEPHFETDELSLEGLFALFNLYIEMGRPQDAEIVAERFIEHAPREPRGYFALGVALERQNRHEDAQAAYRRGIDKVPGEPRFFDAIARVKQSLDDVEGEILVLEEKLDAFPGDMAAMRRIAQLEEQSGHREAATEVLEALVARHPEQTTPQFQLGLFYYEAGRFPEAIERFELVVERSEALGESRWVDEVRYFLGRARYEAGAIDEALAVLAEIPLGSERYPDARIVMARIYEEFDDLASALIEVQRAATAVPENTAIQSYLAGLLQRSGDLDSAVELMRSLIATDPEDVELYYDLGVIYGNAGREDDAIELMVELLERDADHASALNYVGYTWADHGQRLDEAEVYILRALELRPEDGYITDSLGWLYYQQGLKQLGEGDAGAARDSFQLAIVKLEHALELLEEDDPIITRHLADAYRSVSRFDEALSAYRRALELGPEEDEASDIREQIELLESQSQSTSEGPR